jgi:hypothetical protein
MTTLSYQRLEAVRDLARRDVEDCKDCVPPCYFNTAERAAYQRAYDYALDQALDGWNDGWNE